MNTDAVVKALQSRGLYTKVIRDLLGHESVSGTTKIKEDGWSYANQGFLIFQTDDGLWVALIGVARPIRTSISMDDVIEAVSAFFEMEELQPDDSITIDQTFSIFMQSGMAAMLMNQMEVAVFDYQLVEEEMINGKYPRLDTLPVAFTIQLRGTAWVISDKRPGEQPDSITVETLREAVKHVIALKEKAS